MPKATVVRRVVKRVPVAPSVTCPLGYTAEVLVDVQMALKAETKGHLDFMVRVAEMDGWRKE